ncbi:MAG TPA: hypothetical protein ENI97_07225 [Gammaproteobacteria bacterium]|nr:hypothetical protein [Gammaproteobacteria bacterium]
MIHKKIYSGYLFPLAVSFLNMSMLVACQTTQSVGVRDFSRGVDIAVGQDGGNPAYRISEKMGAAGSGYAYLLEKTDGRWRMMYDSFDAKAFAKPTGGVREVPEGTEVLWTDGQRVVVYFGTEPLSYSRTDGSFACPRDDKLQSHRACRSRFSKPKGLLDGLINKDQVRPFVLDVAEIKQAVADTGIVARTKKRMAVEQ